MAPQLSVRQRRATAYSGEMKRIPDLPRASIRRPSDSGSPVERIVSECRPLCRRGSRPMKIGFCMFLWTTNVTKKHEALLRDIKATGYDGVEIPIFVGKPDDYRRLGHLLDVIGLERTAVTAMGDPAMNLISPAA